MQLARAFGAGRVIATASSDEKRALALEIGADVAVDGDAEGLTERLVEANGGAPVDVVLEAIGGEVFDASLEALAPFGRLVTYGVSGGKTNAPNTRKLMRASRAVVGFWFRHCLERPDLLDEPLADLFARTARGELRPLVGATYRLDRQRRRRSTSPSGGPPESAAGRPLRTGADSRGARSRSFYAQALVYVDFSRPMTSFAELGLSPPVLAALEAVGYEQPSPIQEQGIRRCSRATTSSARRRPARARPPPSASRSSSTSIPSSRGPGARPDPDA